MVDKGFNAFRQLPCLELGSLNQGGFDVVRKGGRIGIENAGNNNTRLSTQRGKDFFGGVRIFKRQCSRAVDADHLCQRRDIFNHIPTVGHGPVHNKIGRHEADQSAGGDQNDDRQLAADGKLLKTLFH